MAIFTEKLMKLFTIILLIIVSILVIFALYFNRDKFYGSEETVKYSFVTIDERTDFNQIILHFTSDKTKDKFISEVKKINNINNLNNENIYGRTLLIPVIENN